VYLLRRINNFPNIVPIDRIILRAGVFGLITISLVPLHNRIITRSDRIVSFLGTLPTNEVFPFRVNSGDLANKLSFYREKILLNNILIPLIAVRLNKIFD
jgi:hypothetical protein